MTTNAANPNKIPMTARTSAAPNVTSTGVNSSRPDRPMMIAIIATGSENTANRRAQIASCEVGSSTMRRRTMTSVSGTDAFYRGPFRGVQQWGPVGCASHGVDRGDACLCLGVIEQDLHCRLGGAADPRKDRTERARIATDPGHQINAVSICRPFDLARIGRLQYHLGCQDHGAASAEVAKEHAK